MPTVREGPRKHEPPAPRKGGAGGENFGSVDE